MASRATEGNPTPAFGPSIADSCRSGNVSPRCREQASVAVGVGGDGRLDRVEGGTLAQVVAADPQREATLTAGDGSQAPDQDRVAPLDIERHGMAVRSVGGAELEPGRAAQRGLDR